MLLAFVKLPALEKVRCLDSMIYHVNKTPKIGAYALQTLNNFIKAVPKTGCFYGENERMNEVYYRIRTARDFSALSSVIDYLVVDNEQGDGHLTSKQRCELIELIEKVLAAALEPFDWEDAAVQQEYQRLPALWEQRTMLNYLRSVIDAVEDTSVDKVREVLMQMTVSVEESRSTEGGVVSKEGK